MSPADTTPAFRPGGRARRAFGLAAAIVAVVAVIALVPALRDAGPYGAAPAVAVERDRSDRDPRTRTLTVEVSENGHDFVFADSPVIEDGPLAGAPAFGNAFVTRGYLYPEGTLDGSNGVNPDGSPEFPDEVIGEWLCSGYFIGEDGLATTEGAMVFSTQVFSFGDDHESGEETIVVVGQEGAAVGDPVTGAVTGGSGRYASARGQAVQTLTGVNNPEAPTMGVVKTVTFELAR